MGTTEEGEAVARLKQGDISGLETLVRLYEVQALRAAFLVTHNYAQAEDVVQSAFLRAYERIHSFDSSRPFRPWFMRTVVNCAVNTLNGRRDLSLEGDAVETVEMPSLSPGLDEMLERLETREEVLAALAKLSPIERAAVVMKYYLDWSDSQVASTLHVPPGTVRRRLHDARRRLRRLLPT